MRRQLSVELGPRGVRVVINTGRVPQTVSEGVENREPIVELIEEQTLLARALP